MVACAWSLSYLGDWDYESLESGFKTTMDNIERPSFKKITKKKKVNIMYARLSYATYI